MIIQSPAALCLNFGSYNFRKPTKALKLDLSGDSVLQFPEFLKLLI